MKFPTSNAKSLDGIRVRKQHRNPNNLPSAPDIVALDTETVVGNIFLIADSDGKYLDYPNITFENVAKFLIGYEGKMVFFYNLGYDAECILKLLPENILRSYKWKKDLEFEYSGYKIHYMDRKKLTISKGNHSVNCYDIAQYCETKSLPDAYLEYIKKPLDSKYLEMKKKEKFSHYFTILGIKKK